MGGSSDDGSEYSATAGFIFVFNLIVGAGALALPLAFHNAGLILGTILLIVLCFFGYITTTFMIEAQSLGNAILKKQEAVSIAPQANLSTAGSINATPTEASSLYTDIPDITINSEVNLSNSPFDISKRVEVSALAEIFLGYWGHKLFFVVIVIYLYGDLAIYCTAIPNSLLSATGLLPYKPHFPFTQQVTYLIYLAIFIVVMSPFCFFNFAKTRYLQYATMAIRNCSLVAMIVIALVYDIRGEGSVPSEWFVLSGLPSLFGVSIYAFMCHHSLPSIVTPIQEKRHINWIFLGDSILILMTYIALCWTAVWAFGAAANPTCGNEPGPPCQLQKLYTMNFSSFNIHPIAIFLVLFPVLTLSTNFPMIAITLRNNLMQLITYKENEMDESFRRIIFTLLTLFPPYLISMLTDQTGLLVEYTGAYAGLAIMFFFPAIFVHFGRQKAAEVFDEETVNNNPHRSPFYHRFWIYFIYGWCVVALVGQIFRQIWQAYH